ncbi:MAG TPA: hypothetical protein VN281_08420 [Verrucomicrobiae bacterium]|jgi:hypothetical protein|nr:hypothetical protein [Verrucomicrobiae bacterium]
MKTLLKIAGGIVVCVVLLLVILRFTGFEPGACPDPGASWTCRVPGLWLRGNLVTTPVTDWSFTDQYQNAKLQTTGPFGIPHSIGTYLVSYNGQLYLTSVYAPGLPPYPHGRRWNENVARDPHVRIKIGDNLYDRTLVYLTDPDERAAIIQNKRKKYPQQIIKPGSYINIFHVVSNDENVPD